MSINEMERKARELRQLQALIDEATAEAEAMLWERSIWRQRLTSAAAIRSTSRICWPQSAARCTVRSLNISS